MPSCATAIATGQLVEVIGDEKAARDGHECFHTACLIMSSPASATAVRGPGVAALPASVRHPKILLTESPARLQKQFGPQSGLALIRLDR